MYSARGQFAVTAVEYRDVMYTRNVKRMIDLVAAVIIGVLALLPGLLVAAMIKLFDRGPALLRQERTGLHGNTFTMYKFRSMTVANDVNDHTVENVRTPIGKILRKTSADEIPQLLNIIKGDMSFIGPRPWIPAYHHHMTGQQRKRTGVRPGITGRAQAYGRNGLTIHEKIRQDLIYVEQVSLREDFRIIFQTIKTLFDKSVTEIEKSGIHQEIAELKAQIRDLVVPSGENIGDDTINIKGMKSVNNNEPLVSIVVPVYNAAQFLPDTIASVQAQSYINWELLLVDDSSTDNSVKIIKQAIKQDSRIKLLKNTSNSGAALSRNHGIDAANGRYLAFLDADDLWVETKLNKQVAFMRSHDCAFSFTGYEFADETGKPNGTKVSVPETITYKQALKNTTIWTSTVMFDMSKLPKEGITMPNVRRGQDTATWWKVLKKIDHARGLNEVLSYYRRTTASLSANKLTALKRTWNLYRNVEHLGLLPSSYNFSWYVLNAVRRRV